jgi:hypothetical protein
MSDPNKVYGDGTVTDKSPPSNSSSAGGSKGASVANDSSASGTATSGPAADAKPQFTKAEIHVLNKAEDTTIWKLPVCFNPTMFTISKSNVIATNSTDQAHKANEPVGSQQMKMVVTLLFDTYELAHKGKDKEWGSVRKRYTEPLERLTMPRTTTVDGKDVKGDPPTILFVWGTNKIFRGQVESLEQKYLMFLEDGTPVRAECTLTITHSDKKTPDEGADMITDTFFDDGRGLPPKDLASQVMEQGKEALDSWPAIDMLAGSGNSLPAAGQQKGIPGFGEWGADAIPKKPSFLDKLTHAGKGGLLDAAGVGGIAMLMGRGGKGALEAAGITEGIDIARGLAGQGALGSVIGRFGGLVGGLGGIGLLTGGLGMIGGSQPPTTGTGPGGGGSDPRAAEVAAEDLGAAAGRPLRLRSQHRWSPRSWHLSRRGSIRASLGLRRW